MVHTALTARRGALDNTWNGDGRCNGFRAHATVLNADITTGVGNGTMASLKKISDHTKTAEENENKKNVNYRHTYSR